MEYIVVVMNEWHDARALARRIVLCLVEHAHWPAKLVAPVCPNTIPSPSPDHVCLFWLFQSFAIFIRRLSPCALGTTVLSFLFSRASCVAPVLIYQQQQRPPRSPCIARFIAFIVLHAENIAFVADVIVIEEL
jgi:hypothetical protein